MIGCLQDLKAGSVRVVCAVVLAALCAPALADPPDHAPAHGWRKKHKHDHDHDHDHDHHHRGHTHYKGYTGHEWESDYGVAKGRCNRDDIGTVLGAAVGGVVGTQIGDDSQRTATVIVSSLIGAVIGREIGKRMDDRDRACIGHSLELVRDGQSVRWANDAAKTSYVLTPLAMKSAKEGCRKFKLQATQDGKRQDSEGLACRKSDGTWSIAS